MRPDLDDMLAIAIFAHVAETGSFTAAAGRVGLSKSVVSTRIAALERRLGVKLLHRTTRHVAVTPEGAELHARAAEMLVAARAATDVASVLGVAVEGTL